MKDGIGGPPASWQSMNPSTNKQTSQHTCIGIYNTYIHILINQIEQKEANQVAFFKKLVFQQSYLIQIGMYMFLTRTYQSNEKRVK